MHKVLRFFAIFGIFVGTAIAWMVLGGTTQGRTSSSSDSLGRAVSGLWGNPQVQAAPTFSLVHHEERDVERYVAQPNGQQQLVRERRTERVLVPVSQNRSNIDVNVSLDRRRKGLVWYALYDVRFRGAFTYKNESAVDDTLEIVFPFADTGALYDDFRFEIDGVARPEARRPANGAVTVVMPIAAGQTVVLEVSYRSRGMGSWSYRPSRDVTSLRNFRLTMQTNFHDVDFDPESVSPTSRARTADGESLVWSFTHVVTGRFMSLVMPEPIQPGELASALAYSAPVSLFFFFLVIEALARKKRIDLHPLHFAFLAGAFFAFHLLFSYSADHLEVVPAFALASVVSVFLVVSYLRTLVSARFAILEAGIAQLVYLVGFALAHFAEGFTGLTVTVLAILTLFLLMQWSARAERARPVPGPSLGMPEAAGT